METFRFLNHEDVEQVRREFGTPTYVYDEATLRANANTLKAFPNAFGFFPRYAMKAAPSGAILRLFNLEGLGIDASSGYEIERAIRVGYGTESISLSTQELPDNFASWVEEGVKVNLCSLEQARRFAEARPGESVGLRFNPGLGSGGTNRTNVGGPASSFGIWKDDLEEAKRICAQAGLVVERIHTHIGSGSDPEVWKKVAGMSLGLVRSFPEVTHLNLGGGFKVGRMKDEPSTNLAEVGTPVKTAFEEFASETGRRLTLELEPGTFLVANACALVSSVQDVTSTGPEGYRFLKLDAGMTEVLRPSLYGAQHPIILSPDGDNPAQRRPLPQVVVGHCCESGDLLTPASGDPEAISPRELPEGKVGDACVIEGVGAYCSSMTAKNYNSFPEAAEALRREDGSFALIRKRQSLDQILENELIP